MKKVSSQYDSVMKATWACVKVSRKFIQNT